MITFRTYDDQEIDERWLAEEVRRAYELDSLPVVELPATNLVQVRHPQLVNADFGPLFDVLDFHNPLQPLWGRVRRVEMPNGGEIDFGEDGDVLISDEIEPPGNLQADWFADENRIYVIATWVEPEPPRPNVRFTPAYDVQLLEEYESGEFLVREQERVSVREFTFDEVKPDKTYKVRVRSRASQFAKPSEWVYDLVTTGRDTEPPGKVTGLQLGAGFSSLTARWDEVDDIDVQHGNGTYEVEINTSLDFIHPDARRTSGTIVAFSDLSSGTEYFVRVRAVDWFGNVGPWSDTASQTTAAAPTRDFVEDPITETEIDDDSISTPKLQANAVEADQLAVNAVAAGNIQAGVIDTDHITAAGLDAAVVKFGEMEYDRARGGLLALGGENNRAGRLEVWEADEEEDAFVEIDGTTGRANFSTINVGDIESASIENVNHEDLIFYVRPGGSGVSDSNDGSLSNPLETIQEAVDRIPKINHGVIEIRYRSIEDGTALGHTVIEGFIGSGSIFIYGQTTIDTRKIIYGSFEIASCQQFTIDLSDLDIRIPSGGSPFGSGIYVRSVIHAEIQDCKIRCNGNVSNGVFFLSSTSLIRFCNITNWDNSAIDIGSSATVAAQDNEGGSQHSSLAHRSQRGVLMTSGSRPQGSEQTLHGGQIFGSSTESGEGEVEEGDPPRTDTWNANDSASWRTTYGWRSGSDVYQGEWSGWGNHRGFWFFNDSNIRSTLSGRTITRVRVRLTRRSSGGNAGAMTPTVRRHNYSSQPSGTPSFVTGTVTNTSFAWGDTRWVSLPNSWGDSFRDNNAKGIGIWPGSSGSPYMIFSPNAILEITHE